MGRNTTVKLYHNPWPTTVPSPELAQLLLEAAQVADRQLIELIARGEVEPRRDSFGAVIFDPTRTRPVTQVGDRILAVIELGPQGAKFVPNAAAKADAHERHGGPNGACIREFNHCLSDDDFAWGNSAEYERVVGGGSGLSEEQDRTLVQGILRHVVDGIRDRREIWLKERRQILSGHGWYSLGNGPAEKYTAVLDLVPRVTLRTATESG